MSVNRIKQLEIPVMDETKSGWVVGYIPSDAFPKVEPEYDRVEKKVTVPMSADITVDGLNSWSYWQYCSSNANYKFMADSAGKRKVTVKIRSWLELMPTYQLTTADYTFYPNTTENGTFVLNDSGIVNNLNDESLPNWYKNYGPVTITQNVVNADMCNKIFGPVRNNSAFNTALNTILGTGISIGDTSALRKLQDKIILDSSTNTYYRISIISASEGNPITVTSSTTGGQAALDALTNAMNHQFSAGSTLQGTYTTFTANNSSTSYAIQLTNIGVSLYIDLNSDRAHLNDAPYDMFCIPFSDTLKLKSGSTQFTCSKNIALSMATEIAKDLGSGTVYDVQLLPYCPNRTLIVKSSSPASVLDLTGVKYDLIKESVTNKPKSAVIWCTESTFQVPISTESEVVEFKPTEDSPSGIRTEKYYTIPNDITTYTSRMAVATTDSNDISVYKVNKSTNRIIEHNLYSVLEIIPDGFLNIYTKGNSDNPEIHLALNDYQSADYYFVFRLNVDFNILYSDQLASRIRITEDYSLLNPVNDVGTAWIFCKL